ncbi:hypothetical protein [Pseudanabaena sp. FACHB-2040]|uniref:hypothetical protein n=1 Tax=Pseudanabaena sp. FACHB-2040 TaxID=2692859 RepID=UPI0016897488|nr:hypothetical protein [Pseudanabaena sp. FACHB-2040]MBD2261252.1 hypothetical protein [Pseudanabaena sp. FACHB-2040]
MEKTQQHKAQRKHRRVDPCHYIKFERFVDGKSRLTTLQVYVEDFRLLVAMCHNRQRAEDLIVDLVLSYPGRKGRWYVEKAIWDLERDRK